MATPVSRVLLAAFMTLVLMALPAARRTAAAETIVGPRSHYLALGDSLAFGYQPNFDVFQGYADDYFFTDLLFRGTHFYANMACLGETTVTFINGGCPHPFVRKYPYTGSQLSAALAYIHRHAGKVSPVTIDIGADDVIPLIDVSTCTASPGYAATVDAAIANVSTILAQLHAALNGTGDLIALTYYFPYQNLCPNLVPLVQQFNARIAAAALRNGALVVPVFDLFGGAAVPNPNLCTYTWICSSSHDFHATTRGYDVIADAIPATVGY